MTEIYWTWIQLSGWLQLTGPAILGHHDKFALNNND